jgi:hypothetical protein
LTFTTKQRVAIDNWIATAAPVRAVFFRSLERRYMAVNLLMVPVENVPRMHLEDQRTLGGQLSMRKRMVARPVDHLAPCFTVSASRTYDFFELSSPKGFDRCFLI